VNIQKLFKPYIVKRKHGQCQVLIPLVELDELCDRISLNLTGKVVNKVIEIQMGQDVFMAYHSLFGDVSKSKGFCTYDWHDVKVVKLGRLLRNEMCFIYNFHGDVSEHLFNYYQNSKICCTDKLIMPEEVVKVIESYCGPKS